MSKASLLRRSGGLLAALFLVSCSHARVVQLEPGRGGVIALSSRDSQGARQRAERLMADNCGRNEFQIVQEGEAVVGSTTSSPFTAGRVSRNVGVGFGTSSSRDSTEWRLQYRCVTPAE